jgi:hypothetical protein
MKNKLFLLAAALQITSSSADADEDSWEQITMTLPRIQNQLVGFKTDTGSFRITEANPGKAEIQIYGGLFEADPRKSEALCKKSKTSLRSTRLLLKNTYQFRGFIYPFAASELKKLRTSIENTPVVSVVEVKLIPNASEPIATLSSALEFQENFKRSILANIDSIQENGEFSVDLFQVDDVACDLILGQLVLEVRFGLMLDLAKPIRQPILTADEFRNVYENLQSRTVSTKQVSQMHVVNGAHLHSAISKELNKSIEDFEEMKFLRISGAMFDTNSGALKNYERHQYAQVARSIDLVKIPRNMIPYSETFKLTTPTKP